MSDRPVRRLLGAAARRTLPRATRRRLRRRWGGRWGVPPAPASVTAIVVVETVDLPRLGDALASVLSQEGVDLSVLVAPVAGAAVPPPADDRVRVLAGQPTWQRAASSAARSATGDLLVFVRGCDLLSPGGLHGAARALARSGGAACSGRVEQAGAPEPWLARAQRAARAGGQRPPLDLSLAGTVIRRTVWSGRELVDDEDWLMSASVASLLPAGVDVLDTPLATWFPDHGQRPYGAVPSVLPELPAWQRRVEEVGAAVAEAGDVELVESWRRLVVGYEIPRLLQDAERATPEEWATLRGIAAEAAARPGWATGLPASARAMVHLAAVGRRADLELVAERVDRSDDVRTRRHGDAVLVEWPVDDLPAEVCRLGPEDTGLRAQVSRTWFEGSQRRVELLVALDHVDLADPATRVTVRDAAGCVLDADPVESTEVARWLQRRFQAGVAVSVTVPGTGVTDLEVTVSVGDLVRTGSVQVPAPETPAPGPVVVTDLALDDGALLVDGVGPLDGLRLLGRGDVPVAVSVEPRPGGVRVELAAPSFGAPHWLATGSYRLVAATGNVTVAEPLRGRLPETRLGAHHRVRAHLGPRGGLVLDVAPPLADDEVGAYAQERLQASYRDTEPPVDPTLCYFESYAGRTATDSPRAIFEELRRRRPDLQVRWGIADSSHSAPAGAVPVLMRSREWYDVLARAGTLVLNTDTEPWFRRRPGQLLLQTFHGYPSKAMGLLQWRALDYRPSQIREQRARGVDTWSLILTPTPEMTRHYREQYDYQGPALEHGYPRDDDLVGPGAEQRREAVRRRLGIAPGQTAVLYAPTWREHLASRPRAAEMTDHLDLAAASRGLGEDYVLLLRGHRFHAPGGVAGGGARVLDVTAYPEINDLIVAADVAVLDYSSLRFDFALTGRPMVFLVPDLDDYARGSRRFLFPFEDSAPGPLVADTAGVVEQLLDPTLGSRYADQIAAFNARYNPWQDGRSAVRVVDAIQRRA